MVKIIVFACIQISTAMTLRPYLLDRSNHQQVTSTPNRKVKTRLLVVINSDIGYNVEH